MTAATMIEEHEVTRGGKRPRYGAMRAYPRAEVLADAQLVGNAETIALAGYEVGSKQGQEWWRALIFARRLPLADGVDVNGFPTWRRDTILVWLWVTYHYSLPEATQVAARAALDRDTDGEIRKAARPAREVVGVDG